jgi:hypothetical protein
MYMFRIYICFLSIKIDLVSDFKKLITFFTSHKDSETEYEI